ncbi:cupin domain-containing protein [Epilithonimonas sp. JDS]|uniref:cupin domain-containing protein n=1 Tax=Epilithonimonas sp. JDS TaxID=2902797 RepID=UPI001E58B4A5|nr:cupin domain-containing protein [Epilithonimonas sp. JDS]MCD9854464.1 cupin domain-containing protein [Epilithonimonas sp. JDS]
MKRRNFLTTSLLALPILSFAKWTDFALRKKMGKSLFVRASESRYFGKDTKSEANFGRCIISSKDTENQLYIGADVERSNLEKGGPGLHIHHQDDEIFYVISGAFLFQINEEIFMGKKGDTVFVPRGTAHTYSNPYDNNPGELLIIHQPISPSLEKFYQVFSKIGYMNDDMLRENFEPEVLTDLMKNNAFVGPPIDIDAALKKLKP